VKARAGMDPQAKKASKNANRQGMRMAVSLPLTNPQIGSIFGFILRY